GTITAWSSKTTALVHGCGLENVERVEHGRVYELEGVGGDLQKDAKKLLHNRMTEQVLRRIDDAKALFKHEDARALRRVDVLNGGAEELRNKNVQWALALDEEEIDYLVESFQKLGRNPSD